MSMTVQFQAFSDLCGRYSAAFRHAWQRRDEMTPVARLPHEAQFLPAALALQETPLSPAPRVLMWGLIGFSALALVWANVGYLDVVASAHGKLVPNGRIKTIQPFETATVKAIRVRDGQAVKAGDVLIELDGTAALADHTRVRSDLNAARLQVARGQAMLAALGQGGAPMLKAPAGVDQLQAQDAQRLLDGQMAEVRAKQGRIDADSHRREAELRSTRELVRKLEQTVPIAKERARDFKNLVDQNFVSRHGYLEREQARIEQEADLANLRSRLQEIEAALQETRSQRGALLAEARRVSLDSINEGQQKVASLEQELLKADSRGQLMQLTAPVDGTVQQLVTHTVGGVVTPAQALMVIVPGENVMEVEAFLENKDIGFVRPNQEAEVKVETFQYTKYGTVKARVTSVSHDAINDEKRGLIYAVRVKMDKASINVNGNPVQLTPGMAVTVEIKTDKRRVIDYFLSPLKVHAQESMRER